MLATVGWIATDLGMRVPGKPFANASTLEAHDAMVKFGSMPQMLVWSPCASENTPGVRDHPGDHWQVAGLP
eukprot:2842659-Heterocapsa_arctica.AAC.1